jgi:hypothetical protein
MIKSELILRIAEQNPHLFAKDVKKGVNAILDEIPPWSGAIAWSFGASEHSA